MHSARTIIACVLVLAVCGITPSIGCGEQFIGRIGDGILTSPNFPFNYQSSQNCTYEFFVHQYDQWMHTFVCFTFRRFDLPRDDPDCQRDYIQFDFGDGSTYRYCGQGWVAASMSRRALSWHNNVWNNMFCWPVQDDMLKLTFTSTSGEARGGFYATYTVIDLSEGHRGLPESDMQPTSSTESFWSNEAPCKPDQWTCFNRQCVSYDQLCDMTEDCEDGSDEQYAHARCQAKDFMPVRSCDFEREQCGFLGMASWSKTTPSAYRCKDNCTMPSVDHTFGHFRVGSYLLADFNDHPTNYTASFYTQSYHPQSHMCFSFWYQLRGELSVEFGGTAVWHRAGNFTGWHRGQIHVPTTVTGVARFTATKIWNSSMIAIDDIDLSAGYCIWDEPSCSFEFDNCGWENRTYEYVDAGTGQATWVKQDIPGRGHVMSLLIDYAKEDVLANLTSPPLSAIHNETYCLYLEYHVPYLFDNLAILAIHLLKWDGIMEKTPVWIHNGTTPDWRPMVLEINKSEPFQFQLVGFVRKHGSLKVFIDNVSITRGSCSVIGPTAGGGSATGDRCQDDPLSCTVGPTCGDSTCEIFPAPDPDDDIPDDDIHDTSEGDNANDGHTTDIVSMTSIGLACAVTIGLVLVIGLWLMRIRKRSLVQRRQRTSSVRTDTSSVAGEVIDMPTQDVPPSYSDAVRLPQPRPGLEMTVWSITSSESSPPPAYADIVGQAATTTRFFPSDSGGYSNPAMTGSTSHYPQPLVSETENQRYEHAAVHLSPQHPGIATYHVGGISTRHSGSAATRVYISPSMRSVSIPATGVVSYASTDSSTDRSRRISSSSQSSANSGVIGYTQQHLPLPLTSHSEVVISGQPVDKSDPGASTSRSNSASSSESS